MEHVRAGMYKIISILRRIAKIGIETGGLSGGYQVIQQKGMRTTVNFPTTKAEKTEEIGKKKKKFQSSLLDGTGILY